MNLRAIPLILAPILETTSLPSAKFAELYRFAVLLTGHVTKAEKVMAETLVEVESQLSQIRNEVGRRSWFVARIRERCLKNNGDAPPAAPRLLRNDPDTAGQPVVLKIEAYLLAQRFHALPEPERSALALFYLDFFSVEEMAQLLKMNTDAFSDTLCAARTLLKKSLTSAEEAPPAAV